MAQIYDFDSRFITYTRDESRHEGSFEKIAFPASTDDLADTIKTFAKTGTAFTIQGARTGISGACVPRGGGVISTEKMNRIGNVEKSGNIGYIDVESGARLEAINQAAGISGLIFRPSPTESTAAIGGLYACRR